MSTQSKSARTTGKTASKITPEHSLKITIYDLTKIAGGLGDEIEALAKVAAKSLPDTPEYANLKSVLDVISQKGFDVINIIGAEAERAGYPWDFDEETGGAQ